MKWPARYVTLYNFLTDWCDIPVREAHEIVTRKIETDREEQRRAA